MARTSKAESFGFCPHCRRWMAVKMDGTLQTHGPQPGPHNQGQRHVGVAPKRIIIREVFLRQYVRRDYRYEREAAAL